MNHWFGGRRGGKKADIAFGFGYDDKETHLFVVVLVSFIKWS